MTESLSIIVPCYNEASRGNFSDRIQQLIVYLNNQDIDYELIFINDGSTDDTLNIIKSFDIICIDNEDNQGKGFSIRQGFEIASKEFVMFMDADLAVDLSYIPKFLDTIDFKSCIIASRYCENANIIIKRSFIRRLIAKMSHIAINTIFNLKIKDSQCGFKLFVTKDIKKILPYIKSNKWLVDIEILYFLSKSGIIIKEFPVNWGTPLESTMTNISGVLISSIKEMLQIKQNYKNYLRRVKNERN